MSIQELLIECERLDAGATPGPWKDDHVGNVRADDLRIMPQTYNDSHFIARSRTLLPLLVAVIKNQQRQITCARVGLRVAENDIATGVETETLEMMTKLAAELEDVKP